MFNMKSDVNILSMKIFLYSNTLITILFVPEILETSKNLEKNIGHVCRAYSTTSAFT